MANIYFDEHNYPELLSKPLKGKYLQEFLDLVRESDALSKSIIAYRAPIENKKIIDAMMELQDTVIEKITKGFESPGAQQYGIDIEDLTNLIRDCAHVDRKEMDMDEHIEKLANVRRQMSEGIKSLNDEMREALAENCVSILLCAFSNCLAVQEGREKEYAKMATEARVAPIAANTQRLNLPIGTSLAAKTALSNRTVEEFFPTLVLHDQRVKRGSMIAKMEGDIIYGKNHSPNNIGGMYGEMLKVLAKINELDLRKHADREKLRAIEKTALKHAARVTGLPLPSSPELG